MVIVHPYKGNGFDILNTANYIDKVELLLSDTEKFILLDADVLALCIKHEDQLICFIRDISETVYNTLFPQGSKPGILYGLPRVHKVTCPARPIMSAIGTFNSTLAKFWFLSYNHLLVISIPSTVLFHLLMRLPSLLLLMVSFHVASLVTNIALDETVHIILDNLFSNTDEVRVEYCVVTKPQCKRLLEFAVKQIIISFLIIISMNKLVEWLWVLR